MTLTLDNHSKTRELSLTQALRQIQELNSKIAVLEEQHLSYVQKQQNLIPAIAEICISPIQEVQALRILVCKGEAECRRYLLPVLVKQKKNSLNRRRLLFNSSHCG